MISQLTFVQTFVEDLLDLRTMRDGVFTLVQEPFNPFEVIELVFSVFKPQADAKNINLETQAASSPPQKLPKLIGDERRFKQILINLVKNALKFTISGSITIKANYCHLQKSLEVQVVDTGIGIAQEDLGKLFSKFGKLHRTANLNHEGIGLGLTIVK